MESRKFSGISIIIPALNEAANISSCLSSITNQEPACEVIVVDGGSVDNTALLARSAGAKVLHSEPGRSRQLNHGARTAKGDILLFVHADTILPTDFHAAICRCLADDRVVAGAFLLHIDLQGNAMRIIEWLANRRAEKRMLPYGDQAIFLPAAVFRKLGGFQDMPIMEDYNLVQRLKRLGRIDILPFAVKTSGRRWRRLGIVRTTLINQLVICGYLLGVPVAFLARLYGGKRRQGEDI